MATGRDENTQIGLMHQLVTRYTSVIAVEEAAPERLDGDLRTQDVRPTMPEGMTDQVLGLPRRHDPSVVQRALAPVSYRAADSPYAAAPPPSQPDQRPQSTGNRGSGGGGSVEWLFLAALGALGGGRCLGALRRRHDK